MTRSETHARIAGALAALTDDALAGAVAKATPVGAGIGGVVATIDVGGAEVFVKSVPLTQLEQDPRNLHSTANLFGLPAHCHYGVSSPGFGAWRELAAHQITTDWILSGACPSFPLLHHWRILPRTAATSLTADEEHDVARQFAAWGGSASIRDRFAARYLASKNLVLFLECFPRNLRAWLGMQLTAGNDSAAMAVRMVERELLDVTSFMNAHGLTHFDAHFENILTDGHRLYFSDFGQALCARFTLSPGEHRFFANHRDFDPSYVLTALTRAVRATPAGAEIVDRYARIATLMTDFFSALRRDKTTPYPAADLAAACNDAGIRR
jgi:hypothetical protein